MCAAHPETPPLIVPKSQRYRYGLGNEVDIIATNQPASICLFDESLSEGHPATRKNIYPPTCPELERFWPRALQQPISNFLSSMPTVSQHCWTINVCRMGFDTEALDNPIVIWFTFACGDVDDELACRIVEGIEELLVRQGWPGEKIYVDVCRKIVVESAT
ncbi:hypothetical protein ACMFMG_006413 [Clarireedia jacksonii]